MTSEDPTEEWRDIPGYVGYYQVSNRGRVRGLDRTFVGITGRVYNLKGRVLVPGADRSGKLHVNIIRNNAQRCPKIHHLVMHAFGGKPPWPSARVYHRDGDVTYNDISNLRWDVPTKRAQVRIFATKLFGKHNGVRPVFGKRLSPDQVAAIRSRRRKGEAAAALAAAFDTPLEVIQQICLGAA